tara:strand:- start:1103 stop:1624 length:522 start_codon:yes stop_codon:yes gene_type:complete
MASTLKVQNIAHTGGTNAITIDSVGRVNQPAKPAFRARYDQSSQGGVQGTIVFNTEDYDIGGNYDTSNGRFTAPITGLYQFQFDALVSEGTNGAILGDNSPIAVHFTKNGAEGSWSQRVYHRISGASQFNTITKIDNIQLNATDYVNVVVTTKYAYYDGSGQFDPVFQGFLVS